MRGQGGILPVHDLGYVNFTKVIYRLALERNDVFRDVRKKGSPRSDVVTEYMADSVGVKRRQIIYLIHNLKLARQFL